MMYSFRVPYEYDPGAGFLASLPVDFVASRVSSWAGNTSGWARCSGN